MYNYDKTIDGEISPGQTLIIYQDGTRELVPTAELYPKEKNTDGSGREYWDDTNQIFFTGGHGYGVSPELDGICLGSESEISDFLSGGELPRHIDLLAQAELIRIKNQKEKNDYERRKNTVKPFSASKLGAIKARSKRAGTIDHAKSGVRHVRQVTAYKRLSGMLLRPAQPGLFD